MTAKNMPTKRILNIPLIIVVNRKAFRISK